MTPDRKFFAELLMQALREFTEEQGRDVVYAAPLANRVRELLRVRLGDEKAELAGGFFGLALYPELSAVEHTGLKFRDFLDAFPDVVEVFPTPSGDRVRVLDAEHSKRVENLALQYKKMLVEGLRDLAQFRKEPTVSTVQLVKWLKKRDPDFSPRRLGFNSLADWLESLGDTVELSRREEGGRVRLTVEPVQSPALAKPVAAVPSGYLLVDSVDVLTALHEILGGKPSQSQLPDWGQLFRFVQQRVPAQTWKGRYFMALQPSQHDQMEGFRSYLEAVGYSVIPLAVEGDPLDVQQTVKQRTAATTSSIKKMLAVLKGQKAHVLVVSHSSDIGDDLLELLRAKPEGVQIGLLCIPDLLSEKLRRIRDSGGLLFDLEKDARAFKQTLPRKRLITPETFDPSRFL